MSEDQLFSRDEVMGGLPARRAAALLFLIESRTAHLVDQNRHAMSPFRSEETEHERELAFVEAFALGRTPPLRPTIQDLELHADDWADLVPRQPRLRAALARALGEKYPFPYAHVPRIRAVLGLDTGDVRQAYQRLYDTPIETVYTERPSLRMRLGWLRTAVKSRLESLPPFWTAYSLTVTETIGSGILALPIALAVLGPMPAILLLVLVGLINVITVAWIAETASRTADIRYGGAYFGRMVKEYLGNSGAVLLTSALAINSVVGIIAYSVGLTSAFSIPGGMIAAVWIALLFAGTGWIVSRGSVQSSVASAIGLGSVSLGLLLGLVLIALLHVDVGNLRHVELPGIGGRPWDFSILGLIFGTLLISYFGHTSVGNCAAVVLRRDPGARSLIRGVIAAQLTVIAIYSLWIFSINGALSPDVLAGHAGTVLTPLADMAGPSVPIVGTGFVVLAMGMGLMHKAEVLVHVLREWFPRRSHPVVLLPRGQGHLVFEPRGSDPGQGPRCVLTYLGMVGDQPRLRLEGQANGRVWRSGHVGTDMVAGKETLTQFPPDILAALDLTVTCVSVDEHQVRLRVTSGMRMRYEGSWTTAGLDLARLLDVDAPALGTDSDGALLRWMLRQGSVSQAGIAAWTGRTEQETQAQLRDLVASGALREVRQGQDVMYRVNVARRRARHVPDGLDPKTAPTTHGAPAGKLLGTAFRTHAGRAATWLHSDGGRRVLDVSPLVAIALLTEWLVITGRASFTGLLSLSGTIAVPIIAGVVPALLVVASRRKGDLIPALFTRVPAWGWLAGAIYAFFLISVLLHGLVVWQEPARQGIAILLALVTLGVTIQSIRHGAFSARTVVTLRDDQRPDGDTVFQVVSAGQTSPAGTRFVYDDGSIHEETGVRTLAQLASISKITTTLDARDAREIKLWARRISPQGDIQGVPARARIKVDGRRDQTIDLGLSGGIARVSGNGQPCVIEVELGEPATPSAPSPQTTRKKRKSVDVHALLAPSIPALAGESEP